MVANVFENPLEFDESGQNRAEENVKPVNVENIDITLQMLEMCLEAEEIKP